MAAQLKERATGGAAVRMQALQDSPALVEHYCQDLLPHLLLVYNGSLSQQVHFKLEFCRLFGYRILACYDAEGILAVCAQRVRLLCVVLVAVSCAL